MKIIPLRGNYREDLELISSSINKSKKIVTLTGAGISCNAGIPDFRSSKGLYKHQTTSSQIKGKDLFDISLFRNDETIEVFCKFMESLYDQTVNSKPTKTHEFIKNLKQHKKLIKCYTQNIDGLERQCGLITGVESEKWKDLDVVQLHGDLNKLSCTLCFKSFEWDDENKELLKDGCLPECPNCLKKYRERESEGKRVGGAIIGNLRPNIVLYGENHPFAESLAKGLVSDLNKNPNILLIFGTSLKVHGVKRLVKRLSKKIHEKPDGKVIFINKGEIGLSNWKGIIDYQVLCDCDKFCDFLQHEIPTLFDNSSLSTSESVFDTSAYFTPPSTPEKLNNSLNILDDLKKNLNDRMLLLKNELPSPEFSPVKKSRKNVKTNNKKKGLHNIKDIPNKKPTGKTKKSANVSKITKSKTSKAKSTKLNRQVKQGKTVSLKNAKTIPAKSKKSKSVKVKTEKTSMTVQTKNFTKSNKNVSSTNKKQTDSKKAMPKKAAAKSKPDQANITIKSISKQQQQQQQLNKRKPLGALSVSTISKKDNCFNDTIITSTTATRQLRKHDVIEILDNENIEPAVPQVRRSKRNLEVINYDDTKRIKTSRI